MRAIIDIGTNSVRLLMAEKDEKGGVEDPQERTSQHQAGGRHDR